MKKIYSFLLSNFFIIIISGDANLMYAQNNFELTIPSGNPTNHDGLFAEELEDGSFLVLSSEWEYYPGPGILVDNAWLFGNYLLKFSKNGELEWKKFYQTAHLPQTAGVFLYGATFFLKKDSILLLPYSINDGIAPCKIYVPGEDTIKASTELTYTGIYSIDLKDGSIIQNKVHFDNELCKRMNFPLGAVHFIGDSILATIEKDELNLKNAHLVYRHLNGSLLSKIKIDWKLFGWESILFNKVDTTFTSFYYYQETNNYRLSKINKEGVEIESFMPESLEYKGLKIKNNAYYSLGSRKMGNETDYLVFKYSTNGTLIKTQKLKNSNPIDLTIAEDGRIFVVCDKFYSDGIRNDSVSSPVRIILLDTNLNIISYKDFGPTYATPKKIKLTSGNGIIVTGTVQKSFLDSPFIREPDEMYFLKTSIDSINKPWTVTTTFQNKFELLAGVFPNPVKNNELNISFNIEEKSDVEIELSDNIGRRIMSHKWKYQTGGYYQEQLSLKGIDAGLYFLTIKNDGITKTFKIVRQ